jgi:hypothetical protein
MINETVLVAILLLGMVVSSQSVVGSQPQKSEATPTKLKTFLETGEELRNYPKNGYTSTFTGEFRRIPEDLQVELNRDFPEYKFHIAKMSVLIDPPHTQYDLIVITSDDTDEVQAFVWGHYWMIPPSRSFDQLLKGHQAKAKEDALNKLKSLAKLIAYTASAEVGQATAKHGKLSVELLRGKEVFGFLELTINKHLRLGRLSISGPDGKRLRYFV